MTHYRWKHRSVTLLLILPILVGLLCPAYAIKSTYETGWPVLGNFSEGNVSGSYYNFTTAITCAEYPADGDISREKFDPDKITSVTTKQFENIKVVEIPGLNAATAKKEDYSLTLSVTHICKQTYDEVETITLPKTNYYYPVRVELAAQDGRRCPVYIVAVPAKRDYTQADFSKAVKLHYDLLPKITSLYNTLNETEVGVAGGYHKESSSALSIYCYSMARVGLQFDDSIANNPSAEWVQEWTLNRLRSCNTLSPEQAAYCLSHTMPEIMEYCSQTIANAELRGLRAANTQCISTGEKEYTLTLPAGTDWNKIKGALEFDTIGECVTSASGSWGSGRNVFLTLSAKDIATGLVYNSTQNGIVQNTYTLKLKTGAPVFSVSSFKIGGRTADITEAADGTNTISLHLAKDWSWTQKPDITYTGTGYAFLDENGNEVAAGADGKIDFSKAKTLHLTLDLSAYAASGVFADTMKFTKDYALNITQGNSDACELLSFSVGAAEEQVVLDGTNITVTIPYATKWDSLKSAYTCSYDATVIKPQNEDFVNSEKTPLKYTVKAENGTTQKDYLVTVKKIPAATDNKLIAFDFGSLKGKIDHDKGTVKLELPSGSSKTLTPTITLPKFATISPASGVAQDFTNPVTYTVTAENGATKTYEVTVTISSQAATNPQKAKMQNLLESIIAKYRRSASDDWEWLNLGLYDLKNGYTEPNAKDNFDIAAIIRNRKLGPTDVMTDLARVTLMLTARGYDCSNLAQYNNNTPFTDAKGNQIDNLVENLCAAPTSINGIMFGLLALDIGNYTLPEDTAHNRAYMLDYLLSLSCKEVESGLMGLDGVGSVMFSIGPYQDDPVYGERVKQWLQNGAQYLADRVTSDYTLKSWGTTNSEVISWSLCGLCSAGKDPYTDPRFGTSEKNIITQWLDLFTTSDGYKHIAAETQSNQLATYEGCYALQWYLNFLEKGGNGTPYYLWYRQHDFSKKLSTDAKFLTFEIEGKQGVIQEAVNGGKNTITIELPKGTPLANVTPKFTLSEGATLKAPTLPVTLTADTEYPFTLRAEDGKTERVYYLTVTLKDDMKTSGTELYTDTIKLQDENQRDLEILKKTVTETETGADILLNIDAGKNVKKLRIFADISYGATVTPKLDGSTTMDLSNWVSFKVTAQDGKTKTYRIKVEAKQIASITGFTVEAGGKTYQGVIDDEKNTITVSGVDDSKLTSTKLTPTITLGAGTTVCNPLSGVAQDFSQEVSYIVSGTNVAARTYKVNVYNQSGKRISANAEAPVTSSAKITEFKIYGVAGIIDDTAGTIVIRLPQGTNVTKVSPQIKVPSGCTVTPASGKVVNLTRPITYTVTLGSAKKVYTVSVVYERSLSQQLWDEVAGNNTVNGGHQVSKDPHPLTGGWH